MRETERREQRRVDLQAPAMLLQRGDVVGRFTVQNLSAGGALLTGAHDVAPAAPLRLLLELPNGAPLTVGAHVLRRAQVGNLIALAVGFRHLSQTSEDQIQDAIVELLDRRYRAEHPAVLVVDPDEGHRLALVARLAGLGRRPIPCAAPLDAMCLLDVGDDLVEAVVVRDGIDANPELLAWVAENHPGVKPILLVEDRSSDPCVSSVQVARCFPEHLGDVLA